MFKIGDFSKLTRVPVKTLHYYDDIGLFKPLRVDKFTGYRYYSFDQLPRLNRILALKDLGFPLEQIAHILDNDLSPEQLTGMLRLRQAELQQQVEATQARLTQVAHRIEQIKQEGKMSNHEIILKQVAPVKIAAAREIVATPEQMRERCNALLAEVCDMLAKNQLPANGICLALYHDHSAQGIDVEMALFMPENSADVQQGRAAVRTLPLETMASAVYRGSYDDHAAVGQLHVEVGKWIEANGYRITGASREIYLKTPDNFDSAGVMEIQFPVEKV